MLLSWDLLGNYSCEAAPLSKVLQTDEKKNLKMRMIQGLWSQTFIRQLSFGIAHLRCLGSYQNKALMHACTRLLSSAEQMIKILQSFCFIILLIVHQLEDREFIQLFRCVYVKQWSSFSERLQRLIADVHPRKFPFVTNCRRATLGHQTALTRLITLPFEKYVLDEVIKWGSAVSSRSQVSRCFCLRS